MKKRLLIAIILFAPFAVNAQFLYEMPNGRTFSKQLFEIPAMILIFYLVTVFILTIIKLILDHRLKMKMIDKGVSDKVAEQFLQPNKQDVKSQTIKWFFVLAGIGVGLTFTSIFLPVGVHSIAIMAFSLAISFIGYYTYLKRGQNEKVKD